MVRLVRPGGGSALPGLVVSKLAPKLLYRFLGKLPLGVFVVTGSAGKSTTTKMLVAIARAHGLRVFTNPSTANILQGYYSTIIEKSNFWGNTDDQIAILEMDEGHAADFARRFPPRFAAVLNVFEDQIDRFVDPALVREKLREVALKAVEGIVLNSDDQNTLLIERSLATKAAGPEKSVYWFGLSDGLFASSEYGYASTYLAELPRATAGVSVTSLQDRSVELEFDNRIFRFELPNRGLHFAMDAAAAIACAKMLLKENFDSDLATETLGDLPPVFARGEIANVRGEDVEFILVQNPISFQLNLVNLTTNPEQIMVAIGRDVHDPSWLWTVDFSSLSHADVVSGFNSAEIALRLMYDEVPMGLVTDDLELAIERFLALPRPASGHKTVIFSADAMRRMRRYLGLTDPEEVNR
jgi:UDP-N-acetylmuramyl tripeptide synthase